jgi:hypothetical protein
MYRFAKVLTVVAVVGTSIGVSATAALASTGPKASPLASKTLHMRVGNTPATFTINGDWKLSHAKLPVEHLPKSPATPKASATTSGNWSGYLDVAKARKSFNQVTASFNIPNLNCANTTAGPDGAWYSAWTGLDGWTDDTVEQQGIESYCSGDTQGLYIFYEMYPAGPVVFTGASPGDAVTTTTTYNSTTHDYSLVVKDLTQGGAGVTESTACASTCENSSAEVISEAPGGGPPNYGLCDFGAQNYTGATVTSSTGTKGNFLTDASIWTSYSVKMKYGSTILAKVGKLQGGTAFLDTWEASL